MPGHVRILKDKNGQPRKRKDGSTIWQARWTPAGKPGDAEREERNFKTKRAALDWIAGRDSDVLRGTYAPARKGDTLLPDLAEELRGVWTAKGLEPKTRAGYEAILNRWLIGDADPFAPPDRPRPCRFARSKVNAVTTKEVQDFLTQLAAIRKPNTVRRIYGVLNALLKLAAQRGYIAVNPATNVELPSKKRAGVRRSHVYLEGNELLALADAMPTDPAANYRLAVLVAGSCGLRAGEQWALRRRDVDLLHRELTVFYALKEVYTSATADPANKGLLVGHPKSAASRRKLSIPTPLVPLLQAHLSASTPPSPNGYAVLRATDEHTGELTWTDDATDPDRLLFTTAEGYPVRHNSFTKRAFRLAVQGTPARPAQPATRGRAARPAQAAIASPLPAAKRNLRWHDLRHTAAALSLSQVPNLALVKERLGHENIATTVDLYGKRVPSVDAALADAVGASIFAPTTAPAATPLRPAGEEPKGDLRSGAKGSE
jgi:integrase